MFAGFHRCFTLAPQRTIWLSGMKHLEGHDHGQKGRHRSALEEPPPRRFPDAGSEIEREIPRQTHRMAAESPSSNCRIHLARFSPPPSQDVKRLAKIADQATRSG